MKWFKFKVGLVFFELILFVLEFCDVMLYYKIYLVLAITMFALGCGKFYGQLSDDSLLNPENFVEEANSSSSNLNSHNTLGVASEVSLHEAAKNEDLVQIRKLLAAEVAVNTTDILGFTPLDWAARYNKKPATIRALIAAGAHVNPAEDFLNRTPLHLAAYNTEPIIIRTLIEAKAHVNATDALGLTPLHLAAWFNTESTIIDAFVDGGALVNAENFKDEDKTPLHVAARYNTERAIIDALVLKGANINAETKSDKWTPLHLAAMHNTNLPIIKAIVEALVNTNNADGINAIDSDGRTPLLLAVSKEDCSQEIITYLINDAGADVTVQNSDDETYTAIAARTGCVLPE